MKRPQIQAGDEISVYDDKEDAESLAELHLKILNEQRVCWHFTAVDVNTGQHYSLFVNGEGGFWHFPFTPTLTEEEYEAVANGSHLAGTAEEAAPEAQPQAQEVVRAE